MYVTVNKTIKICVNRKWHNSVTVAVNSCAVLYRLLNTKILQLIGQSITHLHLFANCILHMIYKLDVIYPVAVL